MQTPPMFCSVPFLRAAARRLRALPAIVLAVGGFPALAAAGEESLDARLDVETRLPVYLNCDDASLVFERRDAGAPLSVEVSFAEKDTGLVPAPGAVVNLTGPDKTHEHRIDISGWPDGQYKTLIHEADAAGRAVGEPLVRTIIKQTLTPPTPPQDVADMRGTRMLFADDWRLARTTNLARRVHPAEMLPIEPWKSSEELARYHRHSLKTFHMDADGALNVRISASMAAGEKSITYWAKSRDMKTWEIIKKPGKPHPACDFTELEGQSMSAPRMEPGAVCRPYDPARDGTPELSQVRLYFTGAKKKDSDWAGMQIPGRRVISVWEKAPGLRLILKNPVTDMRTESAGVPAPGDIGDWIHSNDNFGAPRLSADGRTLRFWQTRRIPRRAPFSVHYDNILSERILVTWSSHDGINWTPLLFDAPAPGDPWSTQHYGMTAWWEEDRRLELAYCQFYDARLQLITTGLLSSRDGVSWRRVGDGARFLRNGAPGEWNSGFARYTGNRVRMSYEDHYYEPVQGVNVPHFMFLVSVYRADRSKIKASTFMKRFNGRMSGPQGLQHSPIWKNYGSWDDVARVARGERSTPGLMRYRKDRWVALSPTGAEGSVITKVLRAPGHALLINAATCGGGQIRVELLDAVGNPVPGYSGADAAVFTGDETGAPLRWAGGKNDRLPGSPFALALHLQNADLYALEFSDAGKNAPKPAEGN